MRFESINPRNDTALPDPYVGDMQSDIKKLPEDTKNGILRMLAVKKARGTSNNTPPLNAESQDFPKELPLWMKREASRLHSFDNPDSLEK